jgi:hypothetical protein
MSKNEDRMISSRKRAMKTLTKLTDSDLRELNRRSRYKAEHDANTESTGKVKGAVSDPTLSRVVAIMSGQNITDPVWESVRRIAHLLNDISEMCIAIDNERLFLDSKSPQQKDRTANCEACGREVMCTPKDRLRSGYCQKCYDAWRHEGKPFRSMFAAKMKESAK